MGQRHQSWVYNIAVRMVFHPHDAEEVTQEVFVKAVTRLGSFRGDGRFRAWLCPPPAGFRIIAVTPRGPSAAVAPDPRGH